SSYNSRDLIEHQKEITDFGILSLQKKIGSLTLKSSVFTRYSSLYYSPDPVGDLLFDGISQIAARSVMSTGWQTDASWRINDSHTLRVGEQAFVERNVSSTNSVVLPQIGSDMNGSPIYASTPVSI
ncbi:MAG: TonB-dependent receptor, partial [Janthinobacterium lividum]